jgi:hypothetical protein
MRLALKSIFQISGLGFEEKKSMGNPKAWTFSLFALDLLGSLFR